MNTWLRVFLLVLLSVFLLGQATVHAWELMPGKAGVTAFACSDDEQKMVVGTYYGGVWFSLNGGVTWYPADTGINRVNLVTSIEALDAEADTLVMKCSFSAYPTYQFINKNNMISTNNGQTWSLATENKQNYNDSYMIIDSGNHNKIYCTNYNYSTISEDFGGSWGSNIDINSYYGLVKAFMQDTQSNSTLFASGIYCNFGFSGLYRSDDSGNTWQGVLDPVLYYQYYVRPGGHVTISDVDRLSNGDLFATVNRLTSWDFYDYPIDSFLRSWDDGETWREEYPLHTNFDPDQVMEVQDDPGHLLLLSDKDYPIYFSKMYQSKNFGLSFHPISQPYFDEFRHSASMSQNSFSGFEYVCTYGNGTWKSEDNGANWEELRQPPFSTIGFQHVHPDFVSYVNQGGDCVYLQRNSDVEVLEIQYPTPTIEYAQANLPLIDVRGDTLVGMYYRLDYQAEFSYLLTVESPDLGETWSQPISIIPLNRLSKDGRPTFSQSEGQGYVTISSNSGESGIIYVLDERGEYVDTYSADFQGTEATVVNNYLYRFDFDEVKRIPLGGDQWEDLDYPYVEGTAVPYAIGEDFEEIFTFGGVHGYKYTNDQWQMISVNPFSGIHSATAIPRHDQEPILLLTTWATPEIYISVDGGIEWDVITEGVPWNEHSARNGEIIYDPWRECIWVETAHGLVWEGEEWFNDVAEQAVTQPESFGLMHVYPNPFNASANVTIRLTRPGEITLKLYNALGQELRTVLDQHMTAGEHQVSIDASEYASGTYFLHLVTPEGESVRKLVQVR